MIKSIINFFRPKKKRFDLSINKRKFANDEILADVLHNRKVSINRSNGQKFRQR